MAKHIFNNTDPLTVEQLNSLACEADVVLKEGQSIAIGEKSSGVDGGIAIGKNAKVFKSGDIAIGLNAEAANSSDNNIQIGDSRQYYNMKVGGARVYTEANPPRGIECLDGKTISSMGNYMIFGSSNNATFNIKLSSGTMILSNIKSFIGFSCYSSSVANYQLVGFVLSGSGLVSGISKSGSAGYMDGIVVDSNDVIYIYKLP